MNNLLKKVNDFYCKALYSVSLIKQSAETYYMPEDEDEDDYVHQETNILSSGNISDRIAQFDIKNESLFNQFESFVQSFDELSKQVNNPEIKFEDLALLIDRLNAKYVKVINNPYLNGELNYEEDFNPADLTKLIQDIVVDAEDKLKNVLKEEIEISEIIDNQLGEFYNKTNLIDENLLEKNLTAKHLLNKKRNAEYKKRWLEKLLFIKKLGKSNPLYAQYEKFVASRRAAFKNHLDNLRKNNPTAWRAYQDKMNKRVRKHYKENAEKYKAKAKEKATKIRELKNTESLKGYIEHLKQKLATQKSEMVKKIKAMAAQDPFFEPYKLEVLKAKQAVDTDPSTQNKTQLENAIRKEADAIKNYLDNHPAVEKVKEDLKLLYEFRDNVKKISESDVLSGPIDPAIKQYIYEVVSDGESLVQKFGFTYKAPTATVKKITEFIKERL